MVLLYLLKNDIKIVVSCKEKKLTTGNLLLERGDK